MDENDLGLEKKYSKIRDKVLEQDTLCTFLSPIKKKPQRLQKVSPIRSSPRRRNSAQHLMIRSRSDIAHRYMCPLSLKLVPVIRVEVVFVIIEVAVEVIVGTSGEIFARNFSLVLKAVILVIVIFFSNTYFSVSLIWGQCNTERRQKVRKIYFVRPTHSSIKMDICTGNFVIY